MGGVKQINIKNRTYYFYNDMINLKDFESSLLKIDKKHYKGISIYYIRYIIIKKIDDCENIHSVNPFYLLVNHASGYIEENNGNKYLILDDSVHENKGVLRKYVDVWDGIKNEIKAINGGKENDYGKDYMKFNSDDDLRLNKPLKFNKMTVIIRSVFEKGGKLYPEVFLDDALQKCYSTKELMFQKELTLIEHIHQKNVSFIIIGTLKLLDLNSNRMFVIYVTMYW